MELCVGSSFLVTPFSVASCQRPRIVEKVGWQLELKSRRRERKLIGRSLGLSGIYTAKSVIRDVRKIAQRKEGVGVGVMDSKAKRQSDARKRKRAGSPRTWSETKYER